MCRITHTYKKHLSQVVFNKQISINKSLIPCLIWKFLKFLYHNLVKIKVQAIEDWKMLVWCNAYFLLSPSSCSDIVTYRHKAEKFSTEFGSVSNFMLVKTKRKNLNEIHQLAFDILWHHFSCRRGYFGNKRRDGNLFCSLYEKRKLCNEKNATLTVLYDEVRLELEVS